MIEVWLVSKMFVESLKHQPRTQAFSVLDGHTIFPFRSWEERITKPQERLGGILGDFSNIEIVVNQKWNDILKMAFPNAFEVSFVKDWEIKR